MISLRTVTILFHQHHYNPRLLYIPYTIVQVTFDDPYGSHQSGYESLSCNEFFLDFKLIFGLALLETWNIHNEIYKEYFVMIIKPGLNT